MAKYEEDVYINNDTSVWGSWWKDHEWGYKCCDQTVRNSYCTGAAEASAELMKANIARKEANSDINYCIRLFETCHDLVWGSEVPDDLVVDQKRLTEALQKDEELSELIEV
ncbi:pre-mRNA-splicing factor SLU7-like [Salvia splendens]|nr:pre-mRNA-splicing factor SLU7-like [Salvia splendens]